MHITKITKNDFIIELLNLIQPLVLYISRASSFFQSNLDISKANTAESSPMHIASSLT